MQTGEPRGGPGGAATSVRSFPDTWETTRLEAFSDGVLAIAITLLVLEIRLPEHEPGDLGAALARLGPSYVAYAVSFLIIGIMWAQHHGLFRLIARADQGLMVVNLLLLGGISFLPFPTLVLADALRQPHRHSDTTTALLLYGGTLVGIALLYNLLWHYARLRGLLAADVDPGVVRALNRGYVAGPVLYGAALFLAPLQAAASYVVWVLPALYFLRGVPRAGTAGGLPDPAAAAGV